MEALGREERKLLPDPGGRRLCNAGVALGDPGGAILIVLWFGQLQGVKTNPNGRDSLGMESRYRRQNTGCCRSLEDAPTRASG